ncbi:MAG TPA: hypothetical protein VNO50_13555 [Pyrinomonadaceae bacterium]|nr:hypothetical protein [Pyrinomonadaceae bacterium]
MKPHLFDKNRVGTPLAKGNALDCQSKIFSLTTVNDKGLLPAKAGAGTYSPA